MIRRNNETTYKAARMSCIRAAFAGSRLFIQNQRDGDEVLLGASVFDAVALPVIDEGHIPRADRDEGAVIVVLTVTADDAVGLPVAVVHVPADLTAGLERRDGEYTALALHLAGAVEDVGELDLPVPVKHLFDLNVSLFVSAYHNKLLFSSCKSIKNLHCLLPFKI